MSQSLEAPLTSGGELEQGLAPGMIALLVVFTILPLLAVALRILARRVTRHQLWMDDYLLIAAVALCVAQLAFLMEAIHFGMGKHMTTLDAEEILSPYLMYTFFSELFYATGVSSVKLSTLFLYIRIFRVNDILLKVCYFMMIFVMVWGGAVVLTTIFQCSPIRAAWDKSITDAKCFVVANYIVGNNIPNVITDAVIISMPVPLLWKLELSTMRKMGLIALFSVAIMVTAISIARLYLKAHIDFDDPTWGFCKIAILSTIEMDVGVCCACMPVVYPLFRVLAGRSIVPGIRGSPARAHSGRSGSSRQKQRRLDYIDNASEEHLWAASTSRGDDPPIALEGIGVHSLDGQQTTAKPRPVC